MDFIFWLGLINTFECFIAHTYICMYIEGSQVILSRYFHYMAFNQGLYCLPNFTHSACSGVTSLQTVNADTMAGVIIQESHKALLDSSKRR